jgi:phospholipid-binding lipoprotein MlaA
VPVCAADVRRREPVDIFVSWTVLPFDRLIDGVNRGESNMALRGLRLSGILGLFLVLTACASVPQAQRDPQDPLEPYNRAMYRFNTDFDNAFLKPIAKGYKWVAPAVVREGVTNFYNNIADVTSAVNNLFQFKLSRFGTDLGRVAVNSTVGVGGVVDVATNMGLPSYKEDFGQTLGYWGAVKSPYLVLPLLGPSTLRDAIGRGVDTFTNPTFYVNDGAVTWGLFGLQAVNTRADLLTASKILQEAAIDPYSFVRDAYLQRRLYDIYDGNPPPQAYEQDLGLGASSAPDGAPKAGGKTTD